VNGAGPSPVSWDSVVARAHRRFWVRLAALGAIGAMGAALLLGGGVATRAAIQEDGHIPPPPGNGGKPNLTFSGLAPLAAKGETGLDGDENLWTVTVTNASAADAPAFEVAIVPAGAGAPVTLEFGALAAGDESDPMTFACPGTGASVEIDPGKDVSGDDRDDNRHEVECASTEAVVEPPNGGGDELPNLTVESVGAEGLVVTNDSSVPAGPSRATVAIKLDGKEVPIDPLSVPAIAAGASSPPIPFRCPAGAAEATVDSEGTVNESNEADNVRSGECDDSGEAAHLRATEAETSELERTADEIADEEAETEKEAKAEEIPGEGE
jgi:hypothetical protein